MVGLADDERRLPRYGKPPVPRTVAERARKLLKAETDVVALDEAPVADVARGRARSGSLNGAPPTGAPDTGGPGADEPEEPGDD